MADLKAVTGRFFKPTFVAGVAVFSVVAVVALTIALFSRQSAGPGLHPEEVGTAEGTDHYSIVRRILACTGTRMLEQVPVYVRMIYVENPRLLNLQPMPEVLPSGTRVPNEPERAVLELSRAMFKIRWVLREKVESSYRAWQVATLITIALGMVTTVLVSLASSEFGQGDGRMPKIIKVLAIIFPALGTGAAAIVAFYAPQTEWTQASHSLASLSQLHSQMSATIWKVPCPTDDAKNDRLDKQLEVWSARYTEVLSSTYTSGQGQDEKKNGPKI